MDEKKILSVVPGQGQVDALAEALRNMKKNLTTYIEYHQIDAQIKRAKFLALVKEGFTEQQALEMCR